MSTDHIDVVQRAQQLLEPRLQTMGYELVACDWRMVDGRQTLQIYIDAEGGIQLQDCVTVNGAVGDLLDVEDFIPVAYRLEVSSPGLDRPLRKPADFERFVGREVRCRTFEPIEGRRNYRGHLLGVDEGLVSIEIDGQVHTVPIAAMERANLIHEFDTNPSPRGPNKSNKKRKNG